MSRTAASLAVLSLVLCAQLPVAAPAQADVLLIERVKSEQSAAMPARGLSMDEVERRFGAPAEKRPPVGGGHPLRPPITRWVYPQFSVYFEHDRVVDAVMNRASPHETGPKPVH